MPPSAEALMELCHPQAKLLSLRAGNLSHDSVTRPAGIAAVSMWHRPVLLWRSPFPSPVLPRAAAQEDPTKPAPPTQVPLSWVGEKLEGTAPPAGTLAKRQATLPLFLGTSAATSLRAPLGTNW